MQLHMWFLTNTKIGKYSRLHYLVSFYTELLNENMWIHMICIPTSFNILNPHQVSAIESSAYNNKSRIRI